MKSVYSIRDTKVSVYHVPFYAENEIMAIRSIQSHMSNGESFLSQYAPDYELYLLGQFDDVIGKFIMLDHPKFIISCASIQMNMIKSAITMKRLEEAKKLDEKDA